MRRAWARFKQFWMAEEIPRWFGFSLVVIYLGGIGAVGYSGIAHVREVAALDLKTSSRYAINCLLERLEDHSGGDLSDPAVAENVLRMLHEFAAYIPSRVVRVVDESGLVLSSTNAVEVGTVARNESEIQASPARLEAVQVRVPGHAVPDTFIRAPFVVRRSGGGEHSGPGTGQDVSQGDSQRTGDPGVPQRYFLEVRLPAGSQEGATLIDQADTLMIVLVVMGALFGLYRCLRAQFRSVSKIADRLQAHCDRIEHDVASLRLADNEDSLTVAWNELVDQAQEWFEGVQRQDANAELKSVLERSAGGALAKALNALPDGIIYLAEETRFEYTNSAALRLLGWTAADAKAASLTDARAGGVGGRILDVVRDAMTASGAYEARTVVLDEEEEDNSSAGSYRVWVIPLQQARHHGECVIVVRDVSQQIRAERAREEFVTQVTHELRTPLTNIRAYAETLSSGMFDDPNIITECYNVITKETRRLSRLIEDILSVSQLEVGSIELRLDDVDLTKLLGESVRDVRGLADEKNIDMQLVLPSKLELIRADRDKLAVVINNLLGNALKYTPSGGNIMVGCQITGDQVAITFKDNGIGIDLSEHARVFEKFQRSGDPDVQNESGTGMGLYTAREIVRRQGGDIDLVSVKGEGSTFIVRLPHEGTRAGALSATAQEQHNG